MIPALIRKCVEARESGSPFVEVWGTGNASREFLYVDDCAEALFVRRRIYNESDPVNIGTGNEIKISELVQLIVGITRFEGEIRWQTEQPDGQPRRRLDVSRAFNKFGFQSPSSLRRGTPPDQSNGMKLSGCEISQSAMATRSQLESPNIPSRQLKQKQVCLASRLLLVGGCLNLNYRYWSLEQ